MTSKVNLPAGEYASAYKNYSTEDAQKWIDKQIEKSQKKNRNMYREDWKTIAVDNSMYKYDHKSKSKYKITENLRKAVFRAQFQKIPDKKIKAMKKNKQETFRQQAGRMTEDLKDRYARKIQDWYKKNIKATTEEVKTKKLQNRQGEILITNIKSKGRNGINKIWLANKAVKDALEQHKGLKVWVDVAVDF